MSELEAELNSIREKLKENNPSEAIVLAQVAVGKAAENDGRAHEMLGEAFAELGEIKKAKNAFRESIKRSENLQEDAGYEKYLWMAQIIEDSEKSLMLYDRGLTILSRLYAMNAEDLDVKKKLQGAYCSVAELFMTDLCMREDAEGQCDKYTNLALQIDPTNAEALQTLASMRISQQKFEEAKEALKQCLQSISNAAVEDSIDLPTYAIRTSVARLLIEVEMHQAAHDLLIYLQKEDDEIVDVWYLLGWNCFVEAQNLQERGSASEDDIKELLISAKSYFLGALATYQKTMWDDEGILEHIKEILQILKELGVPDPEEEADEPEEFDWETDSDENMQDS
ncbi:fungal protein [Schizosaccharomyces cryophilus OY26]|uniref:Fungal protein n=1 Tax=Schizosaccharomyces cryophilus (strain OY26 / ATCC MYA-4695 / CBS 11777 / NBRC 106824 / NRRL Y48691) TaxID=653667 RepID=S9W773_SCHCR|nr:uncharacterized protein SPOG_03021 [Schizosaccharomyces cryophilus OY26]EPY53745.1 fungal protein [Schizosaccharomyces cryophilus OY26]